MVSNDLTKQELQVALSAIKRQMLSAQVALDDDYTARLATQLMCIAGDAIALRNRISEHHWKENHVPFVVLPKPE